MYTLIAANYTPNHTQLHPIQSTILIKRYTNFIHGYVAFIFSEVKGIVNGLLKQIDKGTYQSVLRIQLRMRLIKEYQIEFKNEWDELKKWIDKTIKSRDAKSESACTVLALIKSIHTAFN